MEIRAMTVADLPGVAEIDAVVETASYLHVECGGEGLSAGWKIEPRTLRERRIVGNPLGDEAAFVCRQIASGADDGVAVVADYGGAVLGMAVARPIAERGVIELVDVRVEADHRRQGIGTALVYWVMKAAREVEGVRAVTAATSAGNGTAAAFLARLGFVLGGVDTRRHTNHDVVKEAATLLWYSSPD